MRLAIMMVLGVAAAAATPAAAQSWLETRMVSSICNSKEAAAQDVAGAVHQRRGGQASDWQDLDGVVQAARSTGREEERTQTNRALSARGDRHQRLVGANGDGAI